MSHRQRVHIKGESKTCPIDVYPEIDQYIPQAEFMASQKHADVDSYKWSACFLDAMDEILKEKGLRF